MFSAQFQKKKQGCLLFNTVLKVLASIWSGKKYILKIHIGDIKMKLSLFTDDIYVESQLESTKSY